ncbi:LytR/AlgR family response regulator transcription factor [Clostridium folliculivorans]|uniref:Stage 0 sporulation protein A homolog n=1 Tax=Clostridium folliculivorans TaxID=2886038 RepID=A0A9W6DBL1_9CLOT|nr:LytTR family DNA-binding domain-containing protein [Clostridium folliculivorans]GKU26071.1 DNA-binding response regulator [Clostridium folliculivorans]GKU28157.1 DNA-binding response regulator [Clostridium folliculivorans]
MNIILCEDDEKQRIDILRDIDCIIKENHLEMNVYMSTDNPYDVLKVADESLEVKLYVLDVDLNSDINGIELADKIRNKDPQSFLIFITSHSELAYLTFKYKVEAFDYIIKDSRENQFKELSEALIKIQKESLNGDENKKFFIIRDGRSVTKIEFKDILFFETTTIKNKLKVNCINRCKEFYSKLKDVEECLDERFIKCHKSFIVNIDNIELVNKREKLIYMKDGQTCYLSKTYTKELLEKLKYEKL